MKKTEFLYTEIYRE